MKSEKFATAHLSENIRIQQILHSSLLLFTLFCGLLDILDGVANSTDGLSFIVGDGNVELLLKLHDQLNGIQRICAQIVSETCLRLYLCLINTKFINDNSLYFAYKIFLL